MKNLTLMDFTVGPSEIVHPIPTDLLKSDYQPLIKTKQININYLLFIGQIKSNVCLI